MGAARGGPPEGVSRKGWARRVGLVGWAGRGGPGGVGLKGPEGVGRKGCAGWGPEGVHPAAGSGTAWVNQHAWESQVGSLHSVWIGC
jgi:hypothetical protein